MTIFGPGWADLTLQDVQSYLNDAEDEPLLWEAKGTRLDKNEVRTQVCGFANSHEGGYLILGADKTDDGWKANGVAFDGEPITWLSDVIGDPERGVRPRPDFDIHAWPADNGHVAVIRVRSTSTPPCIANGTVYERLPGKTPPVRDPVRLASLFGRGDEARKLAEAIAYRAAKLALDAVTKDEDTQEEEREEGGRAPSGPSGSRWAWRRQATPPTLPADCSKTTSPPRTGNTSATCQTGCRTAGARAPVRSSGPRPRSYGDAS
jgi:hypothetical protein